MGCRRQAGSAVLWGLAVISGLGSLSPCRGDSGENAPQRLHAAEHGVGRYIADMAFTDLAGKSHRLSDFRGSRATVIAMTSTSCPLSKKYLPTLAQMAAAFPVDQVAWVLVNPVPTDKPADMHKAADTLMGKALYVHDPAGALAAAVGAVSTTDTVVLDAAQTVVYHGAIDDQYGIGYALDAPREKLLLRALTAHLMGQRPSIESTTAPGCALDTKRPADAATEVTWHNRVSRIFDRHCVECHRDGGVAPFALTSYEDAVGHAAMIAQVVRRGVMPPWFASQPPQGQVSPWANDRALASSEKSDLLAWIAGGKPQGDVRDAPRPRTFPEGWLIGKPDAVFEFDQPQSVKATGTMPYQNVIVETHLPEDRWVQAIEVRPGAREVVHHVLVFVRGGGASDPAARDEGADERMGYWGIYVPGNSTLVYPEGYAKRLPKGATFRFQMHYTPNGTATEDRTQIGLVFARQPPRHEVRVAGIVNTRLNIPAGEENHRETATLRVPVDVEVLAFLPHMHLRGKAARYEVTEKDGSSRILLDIPRYDFNWQLLYRYAEPLPLKGGDKLTFTSWFDNSAKNPANPDPNKSVRWGPQTYDEMQLGYVEYIIPGATPGGATPEQARGVAALSREMLINAVDTNDDGAISKEELNRRARNTPRLKDNPQLVDIIFRTLDADSSGKLEAAEIDKLRELILKRQ